MWRWVKRLHENSKQVQLPFVLAIPWTGWSELWVFEMVKLHFNNIHTTSSRCTSRRSAPLVLLTQNDWILFLFRKVLVSGKWVESSTSVENYPSATDLISIYNSQCTCKKVVAAIVTCSFCEQKAEERVVLKAEGISTNSRVWTKAWKTTQSAFKFFWRGI